MKMNAHWEIGWWKIGGVEKKHNNNFFSTDIAYLEKKLYWFFKIPASVFS